MATPEKNSDHASDEELKVPQVETGSIAEKDLDDEIYVPKDDEEFIDPRLKDYRKCQA